jgi:hypothetical protein
VAARKPGRELAEAISNAEFGVIDSGGQMATIEPPDATDAALA